MKFYFNTISKSIATIGLITLASCSGNKSESIKTQALEPEESTTEIVRPASEKHQCSADNLDTLRQEVTPTSFKIVQKMIEARISQTGHTDKMIKKPYALNKDGEIVKNTFGGNEKSSSVYNHEQLEKQYQELKSALTKEMESMNPEQVCQLVLHLSTHKHPFALDLLKEIVLPVVRKNNITIPTDLKERIKKIG